MDSTSPSLLARLRSSGDRAAWDRFVELYSPVLYHWAQSLGLQKADAADLVQDVFLVLVRKLPEFQYDDGKSFRAWLKTIILNKYRDRARSRRLHGDKVAIDEDVSDPRYEFPEGTYQQILVHSALRLIRPEFTPVAWSTFEKYGLENQNPNRVADEFGVSVATVYATKSKIVRRLREEIGEFHL